MDRGALRSVAGTLVSFALSTMAVTVASAADNSKAAPPAAVSAGSLALLVQDPIGPNELATLTSGLMASDPTIRAAAARAATVSGARDAVPTLLEVIEKEDDAAAAGEEILALGRLAPGVSDDALLRAGQRFGDSAHGPLARALGWRGASALTLVPRLGALALDRRCWVIFLRWATRDGSGGLADASRLVLAQDDASAWAALLEMTRVVGVEIDAGTLASSVRSGSVRVREETYWHLLRNAAIGRKPTPPVQEALDTVPEARETEADDPVAGWAYELLARRLGRPERDRAPLPTETACEVLARFVEDPELVVMMLGPEEAKKRLAARTPTKDSPTRPTRPGARTGIIRFANDYPPMLVADVLKATGCKPRGFQLVGLEINYQEGAAPHMRLSPMKELTPACQTAVRALFAMALVPADRPPPLPGLDTLLLPFSEECLQCLGERIQAPTPPSQPAVAASVGPGHVRAPSRIKDVEPIYPETARSARRQGTVVVEAAISSSGCVRSIEVLSDTDADLDVAALAAVSQWRYKPTLLNGVPVPVIMTVSVNFKLN